MITVIAAGALRGYTMEDHQISDRAASIAGTRHRSVALALRAAQRRVSTPGWRRAPVFVDYLGADGQVRRACSV